MDKNNSGLEKQLPLYWSIIGWFIWTGILVITCRLCSKPDAVQYISFAATITSLVLGVIAIFFSIVTSSNSSENIGELKGAVSDISSAAISISEISTKINSSLTSIESISKELDDQFKDLPTHLAKVDIGLSELKEIYQSNTHPTKTTSENVSEDFVKVFFDRSSFSGLMVVYASVLAHNDNKVLDLVKFNEATRVDKDNSYQYFHGFLVACFGAQLIVMEGVEGNTISKFRVKSVNSFLARDIKMALQARANENRDWLAFIEKVESFIENYSD